MTEKQKQLVKLIEIETGVPLQDNENISAYINDYLESERSRMELEMIANDPNG